MAKKKEIPSTRELLGIKKITEQSLVTEKGELVFFMLKPTNISVLSDSNISGRIFALMNVLKGLPELEMMCLNSRENFEENKAYLKKRMDKEENPVIRKLLELEGKALDRMQVSMATAREFMIMIRLRDEKEAELHQFLLRIEKILKDQGFICKKADNNDIKKILGVYFEQNVTQDKYEDFDGERWVVLND